MAPGQAIDIRRRIIRLAWGAIRILELAVAAIITRRISVQRLAGRVAPVGAFPPAHFRRTGMSDTVKLDRKSLKGVVEKVNPRGILVGGTWYNYDDSFEGDRPGREIVGHEIELVLTPPKEGRPCISGFSLSDAIAVNPEDGGEPAEGGPAEDAGPKEGAGQTPARVDATATANQVKFVELLLKETGLTKEDLDQLSQIRFKKAFGDLTKGEVSRTISYLGGGDSRGRARRNGNKQ